MVIPKLCIDKGLKTAPPSAGDLIFGVEAMLGVLVMRAGLCLSELCGANPRREGASPLPGSALQGLGSARMGLSTSCVRSPNCGQWLWPW